MPLTYFLSNGQSCILKEKIGDKFIVNRINEVESDDGFDEIIDHTDVVVDAIYKTAPTEKIDANVKALNSKKDELIKVIAELNGERLSIERDINNLKGTKISKDKFIIDRSEFINAKDIVFFIGREIAPVTIRPTRYGHTGLRISLTVELHNGNETVWGYKLYSDSHPISDMVCNIGGVMLNATEEEIIEVAKKRASKLQFEDRIILATDDKYLPETLIEQKRIIKQHNVEAEIHRIENDIKKNYEKINALKSAQG